MKRNTEFNAVLNAFRMSLTVLFPVITFPYTSRIFLTSGSGELTFASSYIQILVLIASLGIYTYGVREGAKVKNNKKAFSKLVLELLTLNSISTIVAYVFLFVSLSVSQRLQECQTLILINGISIVFAALGLDWIYGVYENYIYITVRQIIMQLFVLISMFIFIHEMKDKYIWATLSVISNVGANIFNIIHARKYFDLKIKTKLNISLHIKPVLIMFAVQLTTKVYSLVDTVLLGFLSSNSEVGIYSAAVKINSVFILLFTAMAPVYIPGLIELLELSKWEDYYLQLKKIFSLILGLAIPCITGLLILRKEIIYVIAGRTFLNATTTMLIIVPIILITSCSNTIHYCILIPLKKENLTFRSTLIATIINILLSTVLIPVLNANGAAIGSFVAEIVGLVIAIFFANRIGLKLTRIMPNIKNYIIGALFILSCCMACKLLIQNLTVRLVISILVGVILYVGVLVIMQDSLFDMVKNVFKRK